MSVTCLSAVALAQVPAEPGAPPAPPPVPAEPAAPEAAPAAAPEAAAPAEAAPKSAEERLTVIEGQLEGLTESSSATNAIVEKLNHLKVSGYIQSRYEWHDDANFGVDAANTPLGTNRFFVRRGRLKSTYSGENSEFVLQVDAIGDGVSLKDAEASFVDTWTPFEFKFTMGQFNIPFGFEIIHSSSVRELPERTLMFRRLFPGERDRGARLQARYGVMRLNTALINGGGFTGDATYRTFDQTSYKDFVGRLGADLDFLNIGVSWYYGHALRTTLAKPAAGATPAVAASYERYRRLRLGGDAQVYVDVPSVGGLVLRGEIIMANEKNIEFSGAASDKCKDVPALGWYLTLVQNIGDYLGAAVRVDSYDPHTGPDSSCPDKVKTPTTTDKVTTVGGALLLYISGNLKGTLAYEHLIEQGISKKNNDVFTAQLQAKF